MQKNYALILGGYINGYSIIKELHSKGIRDIALFDYGKSIARRSNKINYYYTLKDKNSSSLKEGLLKLKAVCDYIVLYPTSDIYTEQIFELYEEIKEFCYIPFNYENYKNSINKFVQYEFCEKLNIPYPKTFILNSKEKLNNIANLQFPIFIKPNKLYKDKNIFRGLKLNSFSEFEKNIKKITNFLDSGVVFLVSEFIPGDDTNIYSYNGFRSYKKKIIAQWIGKKLTQYPDEFGVFCSASNECDEIVKIQGKKLIEAMDLYGICEPEFKYDYRDGKYKLMEITIRSTMWNRIGYLSGVDVNYQLFLDATNQKTTIHFQDLKTKIHFVYMKFEILNLIFRRGYLKHFVFNVFKADKIYFAVFDKNDIKPFLFDLIDFAKLFLSRLKRTLLRA